MLASRSGLHCRGRARVDVLPADRGAGGVRIARSASASSTCSTARSIRQGEQLGAELTAFTTRRLSGIVSLMIRLGLGGERSFGGTSTNGDVAPILAIRRERKGGAEATAYASSASSALASFRSAVSKPSVNQP